VVTFFKCHSCYGDSPFGDRLRRSIGTTRAAAIGNGLLKVGAPLQRGIPHWRIMRHSHLRTLFHIAPGDRSPLIREINMRKKGMNGMMDDA